MSLELSSDSKLVRHDGPAPSGFWARILQRRFTSLETGEAQIRLPDGSSYRFVGKHAGPNMAIEVRNWRAIRRVLLGGDIGFAEAYMEGEIDTDDLFAVIAFYLANESVFATAIQGAGIVRAMHRMAHVIRPNTRRGSRRNIAAHYDLGNEFYGLWLDRTMSYSAALYDSASEDLEDAQTCKYRSIATLAGLSPGDSVLELGCGWGGFAELAAREFGCDVTGITLSQQQLLFAEQKLQQAGLSGNVKIRLQDYRDCSGVYDAVVSIEMFEAVGERNWPAYFRTLRDRMAGGAKAVLQIITISEDRYAQYRASADFIQRYIFPGGMLPTQRLVEQHARNAGLDVLCVSPFGEDYARTLAVWRERFHANWSAIAKLGFDERFRRMWNYYLCYCEAGFRFKAIDVMHFQLRR